MMESKEELENILNSARIAALYLGIKNSDDPRGPVTFTHNKDRFFLQYILYSDGEEIEMRNEGKLLYFKGKSELSGKPEIFVNPALFTSEVTNFIYSQAAKGLLS